MKVKFFLENSSEFAENAQISAFLKLLENTETFAQNAKLYTFHCAI